LGLYFSHCSGPRATEPPPSHPGCRKGCGPRLQKVKISQPQYAVQKISQPQYAVQKISQSPYPVQKISQPPYPVQKISQALYSSCNANEFFYRESLAAGSLDQLPAPLERIPADA
jgi:hypothetical protein